MTSVSQEESSEVKGKKTPVQTPPRSKANDEPSMTFALFVYWIIPVLIFAAFSRYTADTEVKPIELKPSPIPYERKRPTPKTPAMREPSPEPSAAPSWPTAYREITKTIKGRRRRIETDAAPEQRPKKDSPQSQKGDASSASAPRRGSNTDPVRNQLHERIASHRKQHESHPDDIFSAISYADSMRLYDVHYHDGGSYERDAIQMYETVAKMALARRQRLIDQGLPTNKSLSPTNSVKDEITLDYTAKSADGIVCGVYTAQGKTLFMANFFERAVESYSKCLEIEPSYLDALNARGSALLILGRYDEAGRDLLQVITEDESRVFTDAFQGLARILQANEDVVPGGWEALATTAQQLIPNMEAQLSAFPNAKQLYATSLNRLYHALFLYHDVKTKNYPEAFQYLTNSYKHKMSLLPAWKPGSELAKIDQTMRIFTSGFWPVGVGSHTRVPIFIVGFVRSGSTLLERVLDSHPLIVGTGENSVFNGRLPDIRNQIVKASSEAPETMGELTRSLADDVVDEMRRRWERLDADDTTEEDATPQRFVDKMLTNYYNIGFIQMLYPNALILHVVREPMDTLFSAYKHEFPSGTLDYTSDFAGLAELYRAYRDLMDHWDAVLPGRVMHVRYEEMVHDMPGVARAIIAATGLPWDESVLDFHNKKHAVNTLSTTQVRKGLYTDSISAWMRYEKELQPLVKMLGDRVKYDLQTSLRGYEALPKYAAATEL
jgi:tetratricopeptide (TPR) repeat protein